MKQKEVVPDDPQFTVGYLIGIPEVPGIGARLTVVFGMGGTETLWLCHLLRIGLAQEFYETISTTKTRFRLITFSVPNYAPCPMLQGKPTDLKANVVVCRMP